MQCKQGHSRDVFYFLISDNWYNNIGGCDRRANSRGDNRRNRCLCRYTPENSSGKSEESKAICKCISEFGLLSFLSSLECGDFRI